jgi:hypothetical protein
MVGDGVTTPSQVMCAAAGATAPLMTAVSPSSANVGSQQQHAAVAIKADDPMGGLCGPSQLPPAAPAAPAAAALAVKVKQAEMHDDDADMRDSSEGLSPGLVPSLPDLLQALYNPPGKDRSQLCYHSGGGSSLTHQHQHQQQLVHQQQQQQLMVPQVAAPLQQHVPMQAPPQQQQQQRPLQELAPGFGMFSPAVAAAPLLGSEQGASEPQMAAAPIFESISLPQEQQQHQDQEQLHMMHAAWWGVSPGCSLQQSVGWEAWQQQQLQQQGLMGSNQLMPGKF